VVPFAGDQAGGDVQAVPDVSLGDSEDQRGERALVIILRRLLPDGVRYRVLAVAEPGDGLGELQSGAFCFGEVRGMPPRCHGVDALVFLARPLVQRNRTNARSGRPGRTTTS